MQTVSKTYRLVQRRSTWYYRRRVPKDLVGRFGKFVQFSLGTKDLKHAKQRRAVADLEWDARFAGAEAGAHTAPFASPEISGTSSALDLIRAHVERIDRRAADRLLANGPKSEAERQAMVQD